MWLMFQGSVAIAGAVVRWLKDNLGILKTSSEIGESPFLHNVINITTLLYLKIYNLKCMNPLFEYMILFAYAIQSYGVRNCV